MILPKEKPHDDETSIPLDDPRYKLVDRALKRAQHQQDALIEVLHTAQEAFGYLDERLMAHVAKELRLPLSWVYGVATFYHFFSLKPQGEHTCIVCLGTACYVKGAADIIARLEKEFNIKAGQTTPDGKFSLLTARCLGSCGLAPVLVLDGEVLGRETPDTILEKVRARVNGQTVSVQDAAGRLA
jgi:bidirectional [NiFe] hydrogenase diaphorase subunit